MDGSYESSVKVLQGGKYGFTINFPAMPDSVELARNASYAVYENFVMPDGFHRYKGTSPLEIPFSFRLHAYDEQFCPRGGLTLLDISAQLHSLLIPINASGSATGISTSFAGAASTPPPTTADSAKGAATPTGDEPLLTNSAETSGIAWPATCLLDLTSTGGGQGLGIRCVGYVKGVVARLNGPWLCRPSTGEYNVPSSLDGSFVFVHNPSQTNNFGNQVETNQSISTKNVQAYAGDVRALLYNTINLAIQSGNSYTGF